LGLRSEKIFTLPMRRGAAALARRRKHPSTAAGKRRRLEFGVETGCVVVFLRRREQNNFTEQVGCCMNMNIPSEIVADMQAVADGVSAGKALDPALVQRIAERSKKVQEELLQQYGVREIAIDLIRETREE
jgi:hypothetical protein